VIIDCDRCAVRGDACQDCVIGVLLRAPEPVSEAPSADRAAERDGEGPSGASMVQLDAPERRALEVLADQGLVPRLRLVATRSRHERPRSGDDATKRDVG
jgi:hypothetical protein